LARFRWADGPAQIGLCAVLYLFKVLTSAERLENTQPLDLTGLLNRMLQGDRIAGERAVALVYNELHRLASREMRLERPGHTLQTTALVNEVYLWFVGAGSLEIGNRGHFFAIASRQMRRILVDHARAANTQRRGGGAISAGLDEALLGAKEPSVEDVLLLDEALSELERIEPRAGQVVELRYFGGHTNQEAADALGVSLITVRRDWEYARSWLFDRLHGGV
jgi:RNA polymerase sigma-70 factor (ECF subfamily)